MTPNHITCSTPGCTSSRVARGMCDRHYRRAKKTGALPPRQKRQCQVEDCDRKHYAHDYCERHYNNVRTYDTDKRPRCAVVGCDRAAISLKACSRHYGQLNTYQLTVERLNEIFSGGCDLCGEYVKLFVDHDHSCCPGDKSCGDCVRGGLCQHCNTGLGYFKDSTTRLRRAVEYLSRNGIE